MKKRIEKYDYKNAIITCIIDDRYVYFYLTNSIRRRFGDLLEVGNFIEFKPDLKRMKIIDNMKCYRINHFIEILKPTYRTTKTVYNIEHLRKEIIQKITKNDYYLFLDLEMTMPPYYPVKNFQAEILQVGYYLTDESLNVIKEGDYYLNPTKFKTVSKRTLKFLNIKREFIKNPMPYKYFYDDFQKIMKEYKPKIIIWGKNDYLTIRDSFRLNKQKPIIHKSSFINLLNEIKKYYNLFDDVGLFKTYEIYYGETPFQKHDALSDAYVLYKIYEAFTSKKNKYEVFSKLE